MRLEVARSREHAIRFIGLSLRPSEKEENNHDDQRHSTRDTHGSPNFLLLPAVPGANKPKFFTDDPVWRQQDTRDASNMQPREIDVFYDTAENLFSSPGDGTPNLRAQNVNTVDEVPDSSWYVNRAGRIHSRPRRY